jgi:acyl carrier protein
VSQMAKLSELGMDSLMTQEIQQSMEKEFGVNLSVKQLTDIPFGQIIKLGKRLIP